MRPDLLIVAALLAGCASVAEEFDQARSSWQGAKYDEVVARWGRKALGAISIGIVTTRTFPALKYALGHGQTCQSVEIGGDMIAPNKLNETAYA